MRRGGGKKKKNYNEDFFTHRKFSGRAWTTFHKED